MNTAVPSILTINAGSSSLRFALFQAGESPRARWRGKIERIGLEDARWTVSDSRSVVEERALAAKDHAEAADYLLNWLDSQPQFATVCAVAHRVVHGMAHSAPERITNELLDELRGIMAFDPEHLPFEIDLIAAISRRHATLPQVACFDTAFHRSMPAIARRLPIPRRFQAMGIERYGFHGLSYTFLMSELERLGDPAARNGRVILAHLGSGASLAAVRDGRSIDTSMGFTPASGTMMSTRSGDLDPGLSHYLAEAQQMSATQFQRMVNHDAGLLGVSEVSSDMRDLLALEATDARAAEAVAMFCYHAKKWIGAYAAALGGLNTLVFAGGIGENAAPIRERICADLKFLGVELDTATNTQSAAVISAPASRVTVRVIRTDEEWVLARAAMPFCRQLE
jgi:acetate kinase